MTQTGPAYSPGTLDTSDAAAASSRGALRDPNVKALEAQQIIAVYLPIGAMSAATYVGGLAFVFLMSKETPFVVLAWWLGIMYATQAVCFINYFQFRKRDPAQGDLWSWGRRIVAMNFVNGCVWGGAGWFMFQSYLSATQAILIVSLFLVLVSGATGLVAYFPALLSFDIPIIAPIIVRMLVEGDRLRVIIGGSCLLMLVLLLYYGWTMNRIIVESLRMRFTNRQLNEALTEQRVQERTRILEAANHHKSEFLANMSHELRTPLNAVIGFSEVLQERIFGELNNKQARYIQNIHSSGHHLLALINEILDLSKIEAGEMELHLAPFRVEEALQEAAMMVKERAAKDGISLVLSLAPDLGTIEGDERKVKQIATNLLSNAVKFTPPGGKVELRASRTATELIVSVSDTGIGIAPEDQQAIFEQFQQVGSDYSRKAEGTGLGLTLTKKFVELHGGSIEVASGLNQGSTFTFRMSIAARSPDESEPGPA